MALALLDLVDLRVARGEPLGFGLSRRPRRRDLGRHVAQAHQLIHVQVRHAPLVLRPLGVEAVREEVLPRSRHRARALARAVVIRHHEPGARDERGRAVGEPQGRDPDPLEPLGRRRERVLLAEVVERWVLERPHLAGVEAPRLHRGVDGRRGRRRRGGAGRRRGGGGGGRSGRGGGSAGRAGSGQHGSADPGGEDRLRFERHVCSPPLQRGTSPASTPRWSSTRCTTKSMRSETCLGL